MITNKNIYLIFIRNDISTNFRVKKGAVDYNISFYIVGDDNNEEPPEKDDVRSRIVSSAGSQPGEEPNETKEDDQQGEHENTEEEAIDEDDPASNDYDADIPITNIGVTNSSNTQSIASNLQGIAT